MVGTTSGRRTFQNGVSSIGRRCHCADATNTNIVLRRGGNCFLHGNICIVHQDANISICTSRRQEVAGAGCEVTVNINVSLATLTVETASCRLNPLLSVAIGCTAANGSIIHMTTQGTRKCQCLQRSKTSSLVCAIVGSLVNSCDDIQCSCLFCLLSSDLSSNFSRHIVCTGRLLFCGTCAGTSRLFAITGVCENLQAIERYQAQHHNEGNHKAKQTL